ncbi:MAG: phosphatase PAP2 family protein [Candidatus Eisenbacteria bacterium]|nr:phosphatase PAP2 family protein [Candidatus Eisenbacteria bacterium]
MIARTLLVAAVLLAWPLQALDEAVQARVQAARRPWLEQPMHSFTNGGRPVIIGGALVALVAGTAGRLFLAEAVVALAPVNLVVEVTKYVTNRQRPNGDHDRRNSSFPSSHAANAFAVAVVLLRRWKRAAVPALALAALVAFSRMYLNKHWLVDVTVGSALGAALAWWAVEFLRRWRDARAARAASPGHSPG